MLIGGVKMKHIWLRILAAATCAAMLMTGMPAIATEEATGGAEIAEIAASSEAVTDNATPEPEATAEPTTEPTPEPSTDPSADPSEEATPAPTDEASPEPAATATPAEIRAEELGVSLEALAEALNVSVDALRAMTAEEIDAALAALQSVLDLEEEFVIESGVLVSYKGAGGDVTVPDGVTAIGEGAFKGCTALTSLRLPNGVVEIGKSAFEGCTALARVTLCDELRSIGPRAFKDCEALKAVDLPEKLELIGEFAFAGCKKLEEIVLPEKLRQLGGVIERGDQHIFKDCVALKKAVLPEGMTVLGASMFAGCTALEELQLPSTLTSIESGALSGCTALESLTLPSGLTQIAGDAFANCPKLTVVLSYGSAAEAACKAAKIAYTYKDAPTDVTLTAARTTIGLNEKLALTAQLEPAGVNGALTFSSSNTRYVTVDANGVVTGKRAGSATITVKTYNGKKTTLKITVKKAPSSVSLKTTRTVLGVGETAQLTATLSSGSAGGYSFSSSDETKLLVDETGLVTALQPGEVSVTVKTYNGKTKSGTITVMSAPESITLAETALRIGAEDSVKLTYALNEGSAGAVSFTSSDETIATVDADGTIRALKAGSATVTATSYNGVSADCALSVCPAPSAVTLTAERTTIGLNEKLQLSAQLEPADVVGTLTFSSSNTRYVTVDANGVVTGKRAGSATITVKTYNGKKTTLKITVKKAPSSVSLKTTRTVLGVGETAQLTATLSSGSAGGYSFSSSDETKLTVDETGLVTALQPGEVSVSVKTYNGKTKSGVITVMSAPESITLADTALKIGAEDSAKLSYTLNEGSAGAISFTSSDETIATVDADGTIRALKAGSATVTATSYNGVSADCALSVCPAPSAVTLTAERTTIGLNEKLQLSAQLEPADVVGTLTFSSSNTRYVTVDANGVVTGKRAGSATITVKTYNGKKTTLKITVKKAPSSVSLKTTRTILGVGETAQLTATLSSGSAGGYSFSSSDETKLTVDETGLVTALQPGEVSVSVRTYNGKTKSGVITVMSAPESITLADTALKIGAEDSAKLSYTLNEGSAGAISFTSSDETIATVDADGTIRALKAGSATVTTATYNGKLAFCEVAVLPAPSYVVLPYATLNLGLGDTIQLEPEVDPGCISSFRYSSSNTRYATVSEAGLVTAKKVGSVTITVKTYNGKSFKLKLNVKKAPSSLKLSPSSMTLGVGESTQLGYSITSGTATTLRYASDDERIAAVNESGMVTGMAAGETRITATTHNGKTASCTVTVVPAPESIALTAAELMGVGQTMQLNPTLLPEGCHTTLRYEVVSGDAVTVDESGAVKAVQPGSATVRVSTHVEGVYADHTILVKPSPTSISFDVESYTVNIDETLQLSPILKPDDCYAELSYSIARAGFFTVDESGLVTPIMRGSTTVTVKTHNGLKATVEIRVVDPYFPEEIAFKSAPPGYLELGMTYQPQIEVYPETAVAALKWTSSDPKIVSVDAETGLATAMSYGTATITATSARNPALTLVYKLVVLSPERCLKMPNRRATSTSSISTTLSQIKNVRASAYDELESLYARGVITKSDYNTRKTIVQRAFSMYLFPWMTNNLELYWKAANSENGLKDYKPGTVYFGMPYTQTERTYNVDKALSSGKFVDTKKGYYLMDGSKFADRLYPGNDCSSFVSMAIWGMGTSHSADSTRGIGSTTAYRTLTDTKDLRPGDILNKSGSHVVMFLYYADAERTQMVIIEQGGGEIDTNTTSCSIRDIASYIDKGYKIRRLATLG